MLGKKAKTFFGNIHFDRDLKALRRNLFANSRALISISVVNKNSVLPIMPESWTQENMILPSFASCAGINTLAQNKVFIIYRRSPLS